jgi:capsular polysaccharide biosynthesis protein
MTNLVNGPLNMHVVGNALLSRFHYNSATREFQGAAYDANGDLVQASVRLSGVLGDRVRAACPKRKEASGAERRIGGAVYLGHLMNHYGHFLTESVSTFWAVPHLKEHRFLFHPFVFGASIQPFMEPFLAASGIGIEQIEVIAEDLLVDNLIVPERTFGVNSFVHIRQADAYASLKHLVLRGAPPNGVGRRVFASRSRLTRNKRGIADAAAFDRALAAAGFTVIFPETMSVEEQIHVYAATEVLCGFAGSAMHNCVFMEPGAHVIELGDARAPTTPLWNQTLCNKLARVRSSYVAYDAESDAERVADRVQVLAAQ